MAPKKSAPAYTLLRTAVSNVMDSSGDETINKALTEVIDITRANLNDEPSL